MKIRKSAVLILVVTTFVIFYSCKKTSTFDNSVCNSATVSYSTEVAPIINTYCNTGGCHSYSTYTQVKSASAAIYSEVSSGSMPRGKSITAAEKQKLLCWINNGALNN